MDTLDLWEWMSVEWTTKPWANILKIGELLKNTLKKRQHEKSYQKIILIFELGWSIVNLNFQAQNDIVNGSKCLNIWTSKYVMYLKDETKLFSVVWFIKINDFRLIQSVVFHKNIEFLYKVFLGCCY